MDVSNHQTDLGRSEMKARISARSVMGFFVFALLSGPTSPQNSVTIYGIVDVGVLQESGNFPAGSVLRLDSGLQSQSRLGFRGKEDLGDGLSANFVLESGLNADNGTLPQNLAYSSQSWVGLAGKFGSVKLGRQFAPFFGAVATSDPFDATGPGDATRLFASGGYRIANSVKYSLPALGGWYGDFAYGAGEVAGNTAANQQLSAAFGYAQGPLDIKLGYHRANDASGNNPTRNILIGGTYDFGPVKAWMAYATNKDDITLDTRDTLIGVSVPIGASYLATDYIHKLDKINSNANADQFVLGYYYNLSVRTNFYALYSRLSNESAASYNVAVPGSTDRIVAVGIRHRF
jgi:predicted porin